MFVNYLCQHQLYNNGSIIAENRRYLSYKYSINMTDWSSQLPCIIAKIKSPTLDNVKLANIDVITELIKLRDDCNFELLTPTQLKLLLEWICTS